MPAGNITGRLWLVPAPLGDDALHTLPAYVQSRAVEIQYWVVENIRTSRRLLRAMDKSVNIDAITFWEWDKHQRDVPGLEDFFKAALEGHDIGLMSEAGSPAVADPGSMVVRKAHELGIPVVPLSGPNAILLALMASGLNGQQFAFHGYMPIDTQQRRDRLRKLEAGMIHLGQTQLFIETPYRNNALFTEMLACLQPATRICVAANITTPQEFIRTMSAGEWKKHIPDLHKQPCIFAIGM